MDVVTQEILDEVTNIDFKCGFDADGTCVGMIKRTERGLRDIGKVCCRGCYHNVGYLRIKEEDLPAEYLPYWKPKDGFWTSTGCSLPVEMRSRRCIIYVCRDADISDSDRAILVNFEATT